MGGFHDDLGCLSREVWSGGLEHRGELAFGRDASGLRSGDRWMMTRAMRARAVSMASALSPELTACWRRAGVARYAVPSLGKRHTREAWA